MRAIRIAAPGGPEVLTLGEVPDPEPARGQILVKVEAAGVNRADLLQRMGRYPPPQGTRDDVPGLEFAGTVAGLGAEADGWRVGDRVMGLLAGGGYAEYVTVPALHVVGVPEIWSWEEAASVPEVFLTAHDALEQVALTAGDRVLIHAVASGVGVALVQLAKAAGATVTGTSRSSDKLERVVAWGLDRGVHVEGVFRPDPDLRDWADVICDLVGGGYLPGSLVAAAPKGRIIVIGLTAGRSAEIDLGLLLRKRLTLVGTVLRSRSAEEKAALVRSFTEHAMPLFESGAVRPVVDRVFAMSDAGEAHRYMEENRNVGSIVLRWD
jgi:putative PIG3 family NAD(P)H quinone oxidoreductase